MLVAVIGAENRAIAAAAKYLSKAHTVKLLLPHNDQVCGETSAEIEVVHVDLENVAEIHNALKGVSTCVIRTVTDLSDTNCVAKELRQGKAIAQAALQARVCHVIYGTSVGVWDTIGVRSRHMDAKASVFQVMKDMDLPLTGLILPLTYESLIEPPLLPRRLPENCWKLEIPMCRSQLVMIAECDIGPLLTAIVDASKSWLHKTLYVCGDKLVVREIASVLTQASGMAVSDAQITPDQWRQKHLKTLPGVEDLTNMYVFWDRVDQRANHSLSQQLHHGLMSFDAWARQNSAAIREALDYELEQSQELHTL